MPRSFDRRSYLQAAAIGTGLNITGYGRVIDAMETADGAPTAAPALPTTVGVETIVTDLPRHTLAIAFPPEPDVRYIATRAGTIHVHTASGLRDEPLLDITDRVEDRVETDGEMGLLGLTLHPEFESNRRLFVRYSAARRDGTPANYSHTFVLAEFQVDDDGLRASRASERPILEIPEPDNTHNAGDIAFGPDGYLYVPTGDGGHAPNLDAPNWYWGDRQLFGKNGQDTTESLLGGILRIDVGARDDDGYSVPAENPLVDREGHRDEYYAWGLRNPWRTSFTAGTYFVADVGAAGWESVYRVEKGGNYGWNVKEGSHCFPATEPDDACPDETPPAVRGGEPLRDPILEYANVRNPNDLPDDAITGVGVVGGQIYQGSAIPELRDRYLFGDLHPQEQLFVGTPPDDDDDEASTSEPWQLSTIDLADDAVDALSPLLSISRDETGELYLVGGGGVHRLVPAA